MPLATLCEATHKAAAPFLGLLNPLAALDLGLGADDQPD